MAEAREPLAGSHPDGVGRCGVGIRRLPGSFYGEHTERRHGWHGNGRYRRSRPVPPGLDGDDGSDDGARHATPDTPLPYHRPQPFESSPGAGWRGDSAPGRPVLSQQGHQGTLDIVTLGVVAEKVVD